MSWQDIQPTPPVQQKSGSPRLELWTRLEELHGALKMEAPTATLTIEGLRDEIAWLEKQVGDTH